MRIQKSELLFEIKNLLKDEYVATVTENDGLITLTFVNGQSFVLDIKEA